MKKAIAAMSLASLFLSGCSGGDADGCTPGDTKACLCVGGSIGQQTCNGDGTAWGSCSGCSSKPPSSTCSASASPSSAAHLMWYLTGCADKTWSVVASTLNGSPQTCYIGSTFHFYADGKMIGKDKCSGLTNNDQFTLPTGSSLHITALPKAHTVSIDPSKQQATLTYPGGGHTFTLQYGNGSSSSCSGSASPSSKAYLMWYLTECTDRKWTVVSSTLNGAPQTCYIGSTFHFYADGKMIGKDKCSGLTNNDQFTLPSGSSVHITALPQAHAVSIDLALQQATLTYPGGDHFFTLQK